MAKNRNTLSDRDLEDRIAHRFTQLFLHGSIAGEHFSARDLAKLAMDVFNEEPDDEPHWLFKDLILPLQGKV